MHSIRQNSPNYKWIYTYDYAPDSVWESWRDEQSSDWLLSEVKNTSKRVLENISENTLKIALLTDTHYTVNGTFDDTEKSIEEMHKIIGYDCIVHLGDMTDGLLPKDETAVLENKVKDGLLKNNIPLYIAYGNHDYNYFKRNKEVSYPQNPRYFADFDRYNLRLIFIDSFDPKEEYSYGFSEECIGFLDDALQTDYNAVIFSHLTPLVRLQVWAGNIRNREKLIGVMNKHNNILAYVNGHNHCDNLFTELNCGVPVISINCAKCEYFSEHKPENSDVAFRELGTRNQESWDTMLIDEETIRFIRFGAGKDRILQ